MIHTYIHTLCSFTELHLPWTGGCWAGTEAGKAAERKTHAVIHSFIRRQKMRLASLSLSAGVPAALSTSSAMRRPLGPLPP
jgi:hypothetical protein